MKGIPKVIATKEDWENVFNYVKRGTNNEKDRAELKARLVSLQASSMMKVPREGAKPSVPKGAPEGTEPQLQAEDFIAVPDPNSPLKQSGLNQADIDRMMKGV